MARIRAIEINNFRGIKEFAWLPSPGVNCLIGPGDSGKSSILDAIDFCLGARRSIQFTDADFHRLDVETPMTIGELDDGLKSLDAYGMYFKGFDAESVSIEDEPEKDAETVMTLKLTVASDLEPSWSLISVRAEAQGQMRNLSWGDRARVAPTRIGVMADYHLGWRRGSVLKRVSEERADASAALAKAARDARAAFGNEAQGQLGETLEIVATTAKELGIPIGENLKAMLDAHSVSFSGGTISLHNEDGIPLRGLVAARVQPPDGQGCVLIIGDSTSPDSQRQFASQTPGAVTVEAVDLRDLISFASKFNLAAHDPLERLAQFAQSVMTNVGAADLVRRVQSLARGIARNPPTDIERVALAFVRAPSHRAAVDLLVEIGKEGGVRNAPSSGFEGVYHGAPGVRWKRPSDIPRRCDPDARAKQADRPAIAKRAVGSTLLLKGLEADVAVVLNAGGLDARNLYVAMTRGSKALTVCSPTPILMPGL